MKHFYLYKLLVVLLSIGTIYPACGQHASDEFEHQGLHLGLQASAEVRQLHFSDLNHRLTGFHLPNLSSSVFLPVLAICFGPISTSVPISSNIRYGTGWKKNRKGTYTSSLRMSFEEVNLLYTVWHSKRSILSPGLGFGLSDYKLGLENSATSPPGFDEALAGLQGERHLKIRHNTFLNFSVYYRWGLSVRQLLFIGAHVGYRLSLHKKPWTSANGYRLEGAPEGSVGGFYAGIDLFVQ